MQHSSLVFSKNEKKLFTSVLILAELNFEASIVRGLAVGELRTLEAVVASEVAFDPWLLEGVGLNGFSDVVGLIPELLSLSAIF